jgi:predicted Ser/Thr protein kinase
MDYITDHEAFMHNLYKYNYYYYNYKKLYSETEINENSNLYELQESCDEKNLIFYSVYYLKDVLKIALDEARRDESNLKNEFQEWLYWTVEEHVSVISNLHCGQELKGLLAEMYSEINRLRNHLDDKFKSILYGYRQAVQVAKNNPKAVVIKYAKEQFKSILTHICRNQYQIWFDANKVELEQSFNDLCNLGRDDSLLDEWAKFNFAMKNLKTEKIKKINIMLEKIDLEQHSTIIDTIIEAAEARKAQIVKLLGNSVKTFKKIINNPRQTFKELVTWVKNHKLKTGVIVVGFVGAVITAILFPPLIPVAVVVVGVSSIAVADEQIIEKIISEKAMQHEKVKEAIAEVEHCERVLNARDNNSNCIYELKTNLKVAQNHLHQTIEIVQTGYLAEKYPKYARKAAQRLGTYIQEAIQIREEYQNQITVKNEEINAIDQKIDEIKRRMPNEESPVTIGLNRSRDSTTFQSDGIKSDKDYGQNNFPKFFSSRKAPFRNTNSFLLGKIPNSDIPIVFEEHFVQPDGNCGFTTLGVERQQFVNTLLSLESNISARESLAKVIENALISQEIKPQDENGQTLIGALFLEQKRFDEMSRKIQNVLTDEAAEKLTRDQLITWLQNNNRDNEAQELSKQRLAVHQAETSFEIYCQNKEVFKYYIESFVNTALWLDYKSALLYAKQTNIALYIWEKDENNPSQLTLIDYHEITGSSNAIQNVIHMLFTNGFTHFNLLSKVSIEERAKDSKNLPGKSLGSYLDHVPKQEILCADLVFDRELGRGGFGVVYKGTWKEKEVAVKQLQLFQPSSESMTQFKQEAEIMAQLDAPNIVQYYGICIDKIPFCIVMEYMPLGSLYVFLNDDSKQLDWQQRQQIMEDIARGLAYLHDKKIIHRDLKSSNVLLKVENNQLRAKLSDFGLAKIKTETQSISTRSVGSPAWMAPELFVETPKYTTQSDMYSYGMTGWEIVSRKRPFSETSPYAIMDLVCNKDKREKIPQDCLPKIANLIRLSWQKEAAKRPSAADAIQLLQAEEPPADTTNLNSSSGYHDNFHSMS